MPGESLGMVDLELIRAGVDAAIERIERSVSQTLQAQAAELARLKGMIDRTEATLAGVRGDLDRLAGGLDALRANLEGARDRAEVGVEW